MPELRCHLIILATRKIFDMVIMPLLKYSSINNLKLTKAQFEKLLSPEHRASIVIVKKSIE